MTNATRVFAIAEPLGSDARCRFKLAFRLSGPISQIYTYWRALQRINRLQHPDIADKADGQLLSLSMLAQFGGIYRLLVEQQNKQQWFASFVAEKPYGDELRLKLTDTPRWAERSMRVRDKLVAHLDDAVTKPAIVKLEATGLEIAFARSGKGRDGTACPFIVEHLVAFALGEDTASALNSVVVPEWTVQAMEFLGVVEPLVMDLFGSVCQLETVDE